MQTCSESNEVRRPKLAVSSEMPTTPLHAALGVGGAAARYLEVEDKYRDENGTGYNEEARRRPIAGYYGQAPVSEPVQQPAMTPPGEGGSEGRSATSEVPAVPHRPPAAADAPAPRCRFLFACDLGDPVTSVFVNETGCLAGTMQGKVWVYSKDTNRVDVLAAFLDEGVRGLYMDADACYVTCGDECRSWRRRSLVEASTVSFRNLDRKNTQSVKHVLQRGAEACVLFAMSSTVVNVPRREHHHRGFRLVDFGNSAEVAPCDFDGANLVLVNRRDASQSPVFNLVHLERNEQTEIDKLPQASRVSIVKLWGPDCLAYVVGSSLHIYDHRKRALLRSLSGGGGEIVAVDAHDSEMIATLSSDSVVKLWRGTTGECVRSVRFPEAGFYLGYPYTLSVHIQDSFRANLVVSILVSADEGVFLVELEAPGADV